MDQKLSPRARRIAQAVLFEALAVGVVAPALTLLYDQPPVAALGLTLTMTLIALTWNYGFNAAWEGWEARQAVRGRTWTRRLVHGVLFEAGLTVILVPVMAVGLSVSLWDAFLADVGLLVFFMVYTVAFTWAFDRIVGLPGAPAGPTS